MRIYNRLRVETKQHPRFIEFENSRFYATDFTKTSFQFLTLYDLDGDIMIEYAHISTHKWVTPDGEVVTCGDIIEVIDDLCMNGLYIDLYVRDIFKPNSSLKVNRVYRYLLLPTDEMKKFRGGFGNSRWKVRRLYDLKPVDDVTAIFSLSQIIPEI